MSYSGAVSYLFDLQKHSIKLGLDRIHELLAVLGEPHLKFRAVHVAGTNGKGSTASMLASMLESNGFKVGLFTSPHLVSFTERIRINNTQISEDDVVDLTDEIRSLLPDISASSGEPTFFEFVTAMAFLHFARQHVDWAVIEVGMGGRLDATNVITPAVSVITRIDYDHKEFLGDTLSAIALEKAGIIKANVPVVSAPQADEVEKLLREKAAASSSDLLVYGKDFSGRLKSTGLYGTRFDFSGRDHFFADLSTPLAGEHQVINGCLAIMAFLLCTAPEQHPRRKSVAEGLARAEWPGRLEFLRERAILLDGAHNPQAAKALAEFIRRHLSGHSIILIAGIMADKDIQGILSPLLPLASDIIFTAPDYGRAAPPELLAERAAAMGFGSVISSSIGHAIKTAAEIASTQGPDFRHKPLILITGSFFTVGEAKEFLGEQAVLGHLREGYKKADDR